METTEKASSLAFTSLDPSSLSSAAPYTVKNLVSGNWVTSNAIQTMPDPMNGDPFLHVADTSVDEIGPFIKSLNSCTKSGLHNPFKNPERYLMLGTVTARVASELIKPEVLDHFVKLIQRVAPKSDFQARGEVLVTQKFLENFGGDQVRFLARSFQIPGDHAGQISSGHRWPYGPVTIIAPFNFPLEIPVLQLMGALYMGNKVTLKCCSKVSVVMEQYLRLLHSCGLPTNDVDFINCEGDVMHKFLMTAQPRMTQFTGSSRVGEILAKDLHGKIKLEDAGFDWKVLGPDVSDIDYVAYVSDQDAYAYSGQKCSAQSAIFVHKNWSRANFVEKLKALAERRSVKDLTVGPILTVTNDTFLNHMENLKKIPGTKVLFGGDVLKDCKIPTCYGSFEPTAVQIPIHEFMKEENFDLCTTEIFGPFQVLVEYSDEELDMVMSALEKCAHHLTAAIVSRDIEFQNKLIGNTVNGTTYVGIRARTTGAPQNHWFGPCGDPRGAGIGTPEAIKHVWSGHREIISDNGPIPSSWTTPQCS